MGMVHFSRHQEDGVKTGTASCNVRVSIFHVQQGKEITNDTSRVTCKRCLKSLETGSALTGWLAGTKENDEAVKSIRQITSV